MMVFSSMEEASKYGFKFYSYTKEPGFVIVRGTKTLGGGYRAFVLAYAKDR